tara:strand:- start:3337 stop:3504 length:168 start_codon:yes stop_codon:yes gene_type:complete
MENNEVNRLKLAEEVWDSLTLADIYEQFIFRTVNLYKSDQEAFEEDQEMMEVSDG